MIIANLIIAFFGLVGTLAAFGGATWIKGDARLIKRITNRGWISLISLSITFSTGIFKEIVGFQKSNEVNQKRVELERKNENQQKKIDSQLKEIKTLQSKIDSSSSNLINVTNQIGSQQLASIEAAFKLAIKTPRETDDAYLHLNGQERTTIPSRINDNMKLYWGDEFRYSIHMNSAQYQASELSSLKLKVGTREYGLYNENTRNDQEYSIRIYGKDPRPMTAMILNPKKLEGLGIKIFIKTTDSSQGQEEFRRLVLNSSFSEFAKREYKRTTSDILYIRTEPTVHSQRRSSLVKGSFVRVLQTVDTWCEIITPEGRQGWVATEFLSDIE